MIERIIINRRQERMRGNPIRLQQREPHLARPSTADVAERFAEKVYAFSNFEFKIGRVRSVENAGMRKKMQILNTRRCSKTFSRPCDRELKSLQPILADREAVTVKDEIVLIGAVTKRFAQSAQAV